MRTHTASTMFSGGVTLPVDPETLELPAPAELEFREIRTDAGRYCRAVARDEVPHHGTPEVTRATRRVWEIAFGLAARRRFDVDSPLAEIARTVAAAGQDRTAALPAMEAEMLLRAALGETVPAGDLEPSAVAGIHLLLFASLTNELALTDDELDDLIAEAEELAGS